MIKIGKEVRKFEFYYYYEHVRRHFEYLIRLINCCKAQIKAVCWRKYAAYVS